MLKKILSILLLVALMLSAFSCKQVPPAEDGETEAADSTVTTGADDGDDGGVKVISKADLKSFKLVYPRDVGEEAMAAVNKLVEKIDSVCDTELVVTNDYILASDTYKKEWEHEILVGKTNREESASFGAALRPYDYGYGYENGKILIYCASEAFLERAVNAFLVDVVMKNKSSDVFFQSDWTAVERYHYTVDQLTLNGVDLGNYEIIYPENSALFEKEMADRLQCYLTEITGYVLTVKTDAEERGTANAFHIGKTKYVSSMSFDEISDFSGYVYANGGDIVVYGVNAGGIVNASKRLTTLLVDPAQTGSARSVTIAEKVKAEPSEAYSTMTFNVYTGDMNEARMERVIDTILRYTPDTVGIQEANGTWMNEFRSRLSDYYLIVGEGRNGGNMGEAVPILYAKERYDLLESGTKWFTDTPDVPSKMEGAEYYRNFTWVLLEDKVTKQQYLHMNVHLDTAGSEIRYAEAVILMQFLQNYNDVAVVLTGDMNANLSSAELGFLKSYGFSNASDYPELGNVYQRAVDWVMVTKDCMALTAYKEDSVIYNGKYASDHYAFYAEFSIDPTQNGKIDHNWDVEPSNYPDDWMKVSADKNGGFYAPPQSITAADRDAKGHVEIPENTLTVELDGVLYQVIRSVEELNDALNADSQKQNNYILAADLDYTGKTFRVIVMNNGVFDGNGYSMLGYELVDQDNGSGKGTGVSTFRGVSAASNITIRNLTLGTSEKPISVSSAFAGSSVGTVLGYSDATHLLENVTVYANVATTQVNAGGFAGNIKNVLVMKDCKFYGTVHDEGKGYVGGLIGKINSLKLTVENCEIHGSVYSSQYAGGVAGNVSGNSDVTIQNTVNHASVTKAVQAGGMIGNLNFTGSVSIRNCENRGAIEGTSHVGGFLGGFAGTPGLVELLNCVNYGSVTATGNVGGMIGYLLLNIAAGDVIVENCLNAGNVVGNHAGGFAGYMADTKTLVTNFANIGSITGKWAGGIIGSTVPLTNNDGTDVITLTNCGSVASVKKNNNRASAIIANQTGLEPIVSELIGIDVDDNALTEIARTTVNVEEGLAWLNDKHQSSFGTFILNSDGNGIVVAAPEFAALQQGADQENANDLRLIGSVMGNTLRYHAVGFEVEVNGEKTSVSASRLHRKLVSADKQEYPAGDYNATFLFAVELDGIVPTVGTVTFSVTAFAEGIDGASVYRGATYLVTFTDGAFVSAVVDTI